MPVGYFIMYAGKYWQYIEHYLLWTSDLESRE